MSNEIKGIGDTARKLAELSGHAASSQARTANEPAQTNAAAGSADTVSVSDTRARIDAARESLASEPVVDVNRVERLREKIAAGSYEIDTNRVASGFIDVESMLASATGSGNQSPEDG